MLSVLLFFSVFFYCTVRKFFILCTIFLAYLRKNCTFLPSKYEKKGSWGIPHILIIKTVWQNFLKNYIYAIRIWWQKYVFLSTVIVPSPSLCIKKAFLKS